VHLGDDNATIRFGSEDKVLTQVTEQRKPLQVVTGHCEDALELLGPILHGQFGVAGSKLSVDGLPPTRVIRPIDRVV
jgi:hypothetical protein